VEDDYCLDRKHGGRADAGQIGGVGSSPDQIPERPSPILHAVIPDFPNSPWDADPFIGCTSCTIHMDCRDGFLRLGKPLPDSSALCTNASSCYGLTDRVEYEHTHGHFG
jgi:hypothetical protein